MEKKKDHKLRAADFKSKKKRLSSLKHKAALRNPDEFYFGMQSARVKNGVHKKYDLNKRTEMFDKEVMCFFLYT